MGVNGVTDSVNAYDVYQSGAGAAAKAAEETNTENKAAGEDSGVVYEPSNETKTDSAKKTYTPNTDLVNKLKADQESRQQQLQSIVEKMLTQQGQTFNNANNIWKILAGGNFEVDEATKLQAQKDIADDGYWGVEKTSDRIIDFATALTGGDPDKIEDMREAFKKGYEQAKKTWGGELPEISQRTYDAVMEKFDKLAEEAGLNNKTETETDVVTGTETN